MNDRVSIPKLLEKKASGEPIVMVTAYDHPSAMAAEEAEVDMILVGDSGAQVVLGHPSTAEATIDEMLVLAAAVRRGAPTTFVVCDVPFGSTEISDEQAVATAIRFVKEAGADAVKLEGAGSERLSRIRAITAAGIPVVAHIGLTPQTATALGGLRAQGRTAQTAERIVGEAYAVQEAGAIALVVEAVPSPVVDVFLEDIAIPVIGIGAGPCNGQVLVLHDLIGVTRGHTAKFVKQYAQVGAEMVRALAAYADDVRGGRFPAREHEYGATDEAVAAARAARAQLLGETR